MSLLPITRRRFLARTGAFATTSAAPHVVLIVMSYLLPLFRVSTIAFLLARFGPIPTATGAAVANTTANNKQDVIVLSPFHVSEDNDVGYRAGSSVSGSRFNMSLKDTAAQVAVFTPEFIMDLGANNLEDVMQYSANYQTDTNDGNVAMSGDIFTGVDKGTTDTLFRVRNMPGSRAIDFFESHIVNDNYNIGRFEVVSGPNSILFGFGSPGGVVNTTSKRALTARNLVTSRLQVGSWERLRNELDVNQVLVRDKLAVRLMGLQESMNSWRKYGFSEQQRGTAAGTYQPFKNTVVRASYEKGRTERHLEPPSYTAFDGFALWRTQGGVVKDGYSAAVDRPNGINQITGVHQLFIENSGAYFNAQNLLVSSFENLNLPVAQRAGETMLRKDQFPLEVSNTGPYARVGQHLHQGRVFLEQRVTDKLTVELAYNKMWNYDESFCQVVNGTVAADPNLTIPGPTGAPLRNPNPYAGRLYLEDSWANDTILYDTEHWRATAAYQLDLGKWFGRHRLATLLQTERTLLQRHINLEILVDQNGVPISNPSSPEGAGNLLYRRNYFTEGAFDTYSSGNINVPFTQTINNRTYTSRWVTRNQGGQNRTEKDDDTWMLAAQSYFWKDRLATVFGYRSDVLTTRRFAAQRVLAGDPRIASGKLLLNEWDFSSVAEQHVYQPITRSIGGVFHLTPKLSFTYNASSNVGQPFLNITVLPDGHSPPPTSGKGSDYGVMLDFFDGRLFLRVNRYETSAYDEAISGAAIVTGPSTKILGALLSGRIITQSEYDAHLMAGGGLADSFAEGIEVALTANATRNWTLQLNYSYNDQAKRNYFAEGESAVRTEETFWRERIATAGLSASAISTGAFTGSAGSVEDEIASIYREIFAARTANELGFGRRPHKSNVFTRYSFTEGKLKGFLVGGGARYQSKSFNQRNLATGIDYWGDPIFQMDLLLGYRKRLPKFRSGRPLDLSIQLNVNNVLNDDNPLIARLNNLYNAPRRFYFQEPRSFRLTTTVSF